MVSITHALMVDVDIDEVTDYSLKDLEYDNRTNSVHELNGTIENNGSIACSYRFKAEYSYGGESFERFSGPHPLWQGDNSFAKLQYTPLNYTGVVDVDLFVEYCGQESLEESFSFNMTENVTSEGSVGSETVGSSDRGANITLEGVESGLLVPEDTPPYWKASSSEIVNGSASLEYDPEIFSENQELEYTVLNENREVVGSTSVDLEVEPTLADQFREYLVEIVLVILALSVFANILLAYRDLSSGNPEEEAVDE